MANEPALHEKLQQGQNSTQAHARTRARTHTHTQNLYTYQIKNMVAPITAHPYAVQVLQPGMLPAVQGQCNSSAHQKCCGSCLPAPHGVQVPGTSAEV